MIDPIGPDPTNPIAPARQVAEVVPEFAAPESMSPLRPKIRHANYDSPEALSRPVPPPQPVAAVLPPPTYKPTPIPTALARSAPNPQKPSRFERAIGKMLPLLEGNVVGAASNLLNHPAQQVNLRPLEESISRLQADHRALAFHTSEQKRTLRRLEDDFAALQESVQKNAADQAELIEHVAKLAKRTSSFMRLVVILLVVSILFSALLCIRIAYLIRF
jgi:hypothetical protein